MANFKKLFYGGIVYVVLAIIFGFIGGLIPGIAFISAYAVLLAALITGMYAGRRATTGFKGAINGAIAGVIGGIIAGIVAPFIPISATTGVPFVDMVIGLVSATIGTYITLLASMGFFMSAGIILGGIGGWIGTKLRR